MSLPRDIDKKIATILGWMKNHTLRLECETPIRSYVMQAPGSRDYLVRVTFLPEPYPQIVITGDAPLGERGSGVGSTVGYGLDWFLKARDHHGLCAKFLDTEYNEADTVLDILDQWDGDEEYRVALNLCLQDDGGRDMPNNPADHRAWVESLVRSLVSDDSAMAYEMLCAGGDHDSGCRYTFRHADVLCAVQQKFRELIAMSEAMKVAS